jgi:predicted O-methyltransferase YrrM
MGDREMMEGLVDVRNLWDVPFPPLDLTATDVGSLVLLGSLCFYTEARIIVEAGTYRGHAAILMARAAIRCRSDYQLYTADPYNWGQVEAIAATGIPGISVFLEDFEETLARVTEPIDFAFIDSGPAGGQPVPSDIRWTHYNAVKPKMRPGGLVVVHDTLATDWSHRNDIAAEATIVLPFGRGLTIYQAP